MAKKSNKVKNTIFMTLAGVAILIFGILSLNYPDTFRRVIMIAIGFVAFEDGIFTLVGMKKLQLTDKAKTLSLIKGFESAVLGLATILLSIFAADTATTIIVFVFAAGLLFSAIVSFVNALTAWKDGIPDRAIRFLLEGAIKMIIAIILFCFPVDAANGLFRLIAIGLIIFGSIIIAIMMVILFAGKKKDSKTIIGEAEVVENPTEA